MPGAHCSWQTGYTVFNVEQIDELPAHYYAKAVEPTLEPEDRIAPVEAFLAATNAKLTHGGNQAFYMPSEDRIQMPPFEFFCDRESYYDGVDGPPTASRCAMLVLSKDQHGNGSHPHGDDNTRHRYRQVRLSTARR